MTVVFASICAPGDVVACEAMTYPGMRALASALRLTLQPVALDGSGLVPAAFERVCREHRPRALYCVPTAQTPTCAVMPPARRRRIAAIAREHDVWIVEDDEDLALLPRAPAPLASMAPEIAFFLCGTVRTLAPGLRAAFLLTPPTLRHRVRDAIRTTVWTAPPLIGEVASLMLGRAGASRLVDARREALEERRRLALRALDGLDLEAPRGVHALWLHLPARWRSEDFCDACRERAVLVENPGAFRVNGSPAPHGVRLALAGEQDIDRLDAGLRICAEVARAH